MKIQTHKINPHDLPSIPLSARNLLPAHGGIYFALRGDAVLYIGSSTNMKRRWEGHHKTKQLADYGDRVRIAYLSLPKASEDALRALEYAQIERYCPRLNQDGLPDRPSDTRRATRQPSGSSLGNLLRAAIYKRTYRHPYRGVRAWVQFAGALAAIAMLYRIPEIMEALGAVLGN